MKRHIPLWISGVSWYFAVVLFGLGATCWIAPHLIFGSEGYRTVARGIIGALGAFSMSAGLSVAWARLHSNHAELAALLRMIAWSSAGIPAVVFYNLGALEPLRQSTGVDIFLFVGGVFLFLLIPACLAFMALKNIADPT